MAIIFFLENTFGVILSYFETGHGYNPILTAREAASMETRKCPKCGKEGTNGSKTCPDCGSILIEKGKEVSFQSDRETLIHRIRDYDTSNDWILLALGIVFTFSVAGIVLLVLGIVGLVRHDGNNKQVRDIAYYDSNEDYFYLVSYNGNEMKIKPKDCKGTVKWENGKVYYTTNFLGKGSLEEVNAFNAKVNNLCEGYF